MGPAAPVAVGTGSNSQTFLDKGAILPAALPPLLLALTPNIPYRLTGLLAAAHHGCCLGNTLLLTQKL